MGFFVDEILKYYFVVKGFIYIYIHFSKIKTPSYFQTM